MPRRSVGDPEHIGITHAEAGRAMSAGVAAVRLLASCSPEIGLLLGRMRRLVSPAAAGVAGWVLIVALVGANARPLSLATYNVQNYTLTDRMVDGIYRRSYPKPEAEKEALRRVIRMLNADILVLQEMGGRPFLEELRRDLRGDAVHYPHGDVLEAADSDRRLGFLSRERVVSMRGHTDLTIPYFGNREPVKRGLLELRFETFTVFVVHLKSRYTDRKDDPESAIRRGAEATALRNRILEICPDPASIGFVILGDYNDSRAGAGTRYFLARGATQISTLLPAADSRGDAWTHHYAREDTYSRVDHILVSPALLPRVREGRAVIWDHPDVSQASDHRPVRIILDLP